MILEVYKKEVEFKPILEKRYGKPIFLKIFISRIIEQYCYRLIYGCFFSENCK